MKIAGTALRLAEELDEIKRWGRSGPPVFAQHPMGMTPNEFHQWLHKLPVQLTFPF